MIKNELLKISSYLSEKQSGKDLLYNYKLDIVAVNFKLNAISLLN